MNLPILPYNPNIFILLLNIEKTTLIMVTGNATDIIEYLHI